MNVNWSMGAYNLSASWWSKVVDKEKFNLGKCLSSIQVIDDVHVASKNHQLSCSALCQGLIDREENASTYNHCFKSG